MDSVLRCAAAVEKQVAHPGDGNSRCLFAVLPLYSISPRIQSHNEPPRPIFNPQFVRARQHAHDLRGYRRSTTKEGQGITPVANVGATNEVRVDDGREPPKRRTCQVQRVGIGGRKGAGGRHVGGQSSVVNVELEDLKAGITSRMVRVDFSHIQGKGYDEQNAANF